MYWFAASHPVTLSDCNEFRQPLGLGPALPFPLSTYKVAPSALTLTAFGYQPVGIKPTMRLSSGSLSNAITATEFVPPLVTYSVLSSGESARRLGLLPLDVPLLG